MKMRFGLGVLAFGEDSVAGIHHAKHPGKKYETLQALPTSEALTSELNYQGNPSFKLVGVGVFAGLLSLSKTK